MINAAKAARAARVADGGGTGMDEYVWPEAAKMFLKNVTRWKDGKEIAPVDQSGRSEVRTEFTKDVLEKAGMSRISAVESYWQQQIYSGRGVPPPVKAGDAEVVAFVAANPGSIGYVSATADTTGVKVVEVR